MKVQVDELSVDDVIADLRRFRTGRVRWSNGPQRFREFTTIGEVCRGDNEELTDERVRDQLNQMLGSYVAWLKTDGACLGDDSRRPLGLAAEHLLRLNSETAELGMVEEENSIDAAVASGWGVDHPYESSQKMKPRTFQQEHLDDTYKQLAYKFLEFAVSYEVPLEKVDDVYVETSRGLRQVNPRLRRRRLSIGLLLAVLSTVTIVGVVALALHWLLASDQAGQFAPSQPSMSEGVGVASGIQAINRSHAPKWGQEIAAEPVDQIEFDVWLANRSKTDAGPFEAWLETQELGYSNGRRVRVVVTDETDRVVIRSRWLLSRSMTNPYGPLAISGNQIGNVSGPDDEVRFYDDENRRRETGEIQTAASFPSGTGIPSQRQPLQVPEGAYSIKFPKLEAEQNIHAMFYLTWSPSGTIPTLKNLVGFTDVVVNDQRVEPSPNIDVDVGDKVVVTETVAPSSTDVVALPVRVRAVVRAETSSHPARLTFVLVGPKIGRLGTSSIKAVSAFGPRGHPVTFELIPGTTSIYSVDRDSCTRNRVPRWMAQVASNDLTRTEGLDIGAVGGYLPRDRCSGEGFRKKFTASFLVVSAD